MELRSFAIVALFAGVVLVSLPAAAGTAEQTSVMAAVHQFFNGLNRGDVKTAVAACASPAAVVDDFPPHTWQGPSACMDWATAFGASLKQAGDTNPHVALGTPWRVDVTADRAYVVIPATFTYKEHGKAMTESGSSFTAALHRTAAGWRITGWAWSKH
ncbi:MAG: nuclear transport factor 2 family protein [Candidatus Eremiobacteraeota bacterium]|nr:nuclear transport factor 2 family protein [Candidatus Eremiobacteraeota bacterium]